MKVILHDHGSFPFLKLSSVGVTFLPLTRWFRLVLALGKRDTGFVEKLKVHGSTHRKDKFQFYGNPYNITTY